MKIRLQTLAAEAASPWAGTRAGRSAARRRPAMLRASHYMRTGGSTRVAPIVGIPTSHKARWRPFPHDGERVYPTHTHDRTSWRGTCNARRPRAHGLAEASLAQHCCTLRARSLVHSSLDVMQCAVAKAIHHCSSTATIDITTPFVHTARLHLT